MRRATAASVLVALTLASAFPARAATPDAESAASALVTDAARAYDENHLAEALDLLARAYALSPRPSIVYNQAQVLRAQQECAAARDAYDRFIAQTGPDDPNRERALLRRAEMQSCVERRADGAVVPPPAGTDVPSPPPAENATQPPTIPVPVGGDAALPRPAIALTSRDPAGGAPAPGPALRLDANGGPAPERSPGRALRLSGWTLVGVSVLAAGAGALFAWKAHQIQEDLNARLAPEPPPPWTTELQARDDEGRRYATWARWAGVAAAVTGCGGITLLIVSHRMTGVDARGAGAAPTTAALGFTGTF